MVMRLPLSSEIVPGLGGSIDADLLKGVAGAVAITSIGVAGSTLTIGYKDVNDAVQSVVLTAGSGASITSGTADPSGGAAEDFYLQVNASNLVQSVWLNVAGTWTEYTLPAGDGTSSFYDLSDTPTITGPNNVAGRFLSLNLDDSLDFVFRGESFWTATAVYTQPMTRLRSPF